MTTTPEPPAPEPTGAEPPAPGERLRPDDEMAGAQRALADAEATVDALEESLDMDALDQPRRILFAHAHPDDETIGTGATMALYAAGGARVTLVTSTLGEQGEVLVPELAHIAADRDDQLGPQRIEELATAMEALGVADHRFLGGPGRWRDSDMMGRPANDRPDCFWQADLDEAVGEMVRIIREVRPQVVVTYDENGGYGHPDHIQTHRVAVAAFDAAGDPERYPEAGEPWQPSKLYYTAVARSFLQSWIDAVRDNPELTDFFGPDVQSAADLPFGVDDDVITAEIDACDFFEHKMAAMRAHRTQIAVDGPFFALADGVGQRSWGIEQYILVRGEAGPDLDANGRETDLFSGVA